MSGGAKFIAELAKVERRKNNVIVKSAKVKETITRAEFDALKIAEIPRKAIALKGIAKILDKFF